MRKLPIGGSETIAIVSVLAILGLLLFAYLDRQAQSRDLLALNTARRVQPLAQKLAAQEGAAFNLQALAGAGLAIPSPIKVEVKAGPKDPGGWRVSVWHPDGTKRYLVTQGKIQPEFI